MHRSKHGSLLEFCDEVEGSYRLLNHLSHGCVVAVPSLIPRKRGDRTRADHPDRGWPSCTDLVISPLAWALQPRPRSNAATGADLAR